MQDQEIEEIIEVGRRTSPVMSQTVQVFAAAEEEEEEESREGGGEQYAHGQGQAVKSS